MSTAQLSPGTVVDGRFTIGAATWARQGAQSYAATDEHGQPVVFTAYAPECFSSALVLERSLRELRQLQNVQSPRAAAVLGCGKLHDGGVYEVNVALPETRLDALVARGPLAGPDASTIIEQIGESLLEAQKAGVIHRNLGPRVVFVGPQGAVVTGFSVGEPHSDKSFGPLDTIAPEQVEGKVVDQRTLIYNLAALMHMLITGAPLFAGDAPTQLHAHLTREVGDEVHGRLRRALGKDPRMRPMMLKQFLAELRAIGGGAPRVPTAPSAAAVEAPPVPGGNLATPGGAAKPSSRGWTMFMQGDAPAAPAAGSAPAPALAQAPAAETSAKPKTRGWTMFMEGSEEPAKPQQPEAAPPKPSTRGWTMFMEDDQAGGAPAGEAEASAAPQQQAAAPAPAAEGAQPKTRGWTMFMEEEQGQEQAAPPEQGTIVGPAPLPLPVVAPPLAGGPAAKPSTRGWTMFMKADEESAAEAVALAEPAAQPDEPETQIFNAPGAAQAPSAPMAPPAATAPAAAASTPKSRGWTMFTEVEDEAPAEPVAAQAPAPAPEPAPELAASDSSASGSQPRRGEGDASSKKRGWTMFMEKPLDAQAKDPLGGAAASGGESNASGWTVFSPTVDGRTSQAASDSASLAMEPGLESRPREGSGPRPVASSIEVPDVAAGQDAMPSYDVASLGAASGQTNLASDDEAAARAQALADAERLRAKTLIVTGPPDASLGARPMTMVTPPGSSPAVQRMITEPAGMNPVGSEPLAGPAPGSIGTAVPGAVSGPISTGMTGPISTGISGPISTGSAGMPVHTGTSSPVPTKKGSPVGLIVVGVVLVIVAIVAAVMLTS